MNTRTRLKAGLLVLVAAVSAWLMVGHFQRSRAHEERLRHDSRAIETLLSESTPSAP